MSMPVDGVELIIPTDLYNILNYGRVHPNLSDATYLLLLDARSRHEYNESHIITAKRAPRNENDEYVVPYDSELECKTHVIVYDGKTDSLKDPGDALNCAKVMWSRGSRNTVKVLQGGYEDFSALYPFLRTQKIMYTPRELDDIKTYPIEIIPGLLYIGNWRHGNAAYIQKDLKIKGHVNCNEEPETFFTEAGSHLMHIALPDSNEADLLSSLKPVCLYIDGHLQQNEPVLLFSKLGISRCATVAMAYLMFSQQALLEEAYNRVMKCCPYVRPNRGFVNQLSQWEEEICGEKKTEISDPGY